MKPLIQTVTLTGADDSIQPSDLAKLSNEFPFVEWGILLSKSREGTNRYPTSEWMKQLNTICGLVSPPRLRLSGHICGRWVRDICDGNWTFLDECTEIYEMFSRFQLNFHGLVHKLNREKFIEGFEDERLQNRQFIFQLDDVNNDILEVAKGSGIDAVALFDLSGGAGRLPEEWPKANGVCGYAGGLGPENLQSQLELIEQVAGDSSPIWIDSETRVRSGNDQQFDLDKVRSFLEIAKDWMM